MVLGADTAASLPSWKNADYLMQFPCIVYPRKGIALENNASETVLQNVSLQDISATQIRLEKKGDRLKNWLPVSVFTYIQTHQLFSDT
jgi:nicotinic acid mononucleotide adenylyltransferase